MKIKIAPVMIATLSTCAELERENIKFRLNTDAEGGLLNVKSFIDI
ncbi:hypothetical protein LJB91_02080 [Bacteroidales bacterium OttesenSCG-928-L03]|nr:hypothetical protein [Bacteroidales bacterium OttesenSCG-928-L03]